VKKKRTLLFQNVQDQRGSKKFIPNLFWIEEKTNPLIPKSSRSKRIEKVRTKAFWIEEKTNTIIPKIFKIEDKRKSLLPNFL